MKQRGNEENMKESVKNHRETLKIVKFMETYKNAKDHQIGEERKLHCVLHHSSLFSLHIHITTYIYIYIYTHLHPHPYYYICLV